ncbi:hypothetical protein [Halomicrobium salinisoli]|uniref:hypothetical protein n=1 Tax=Halomicrobium salinisoli TaxID=2878391 RepID=UPI001CF02B1E|nr:hypothetical protein [Halomicrobium salinisoli]
MEGVRRGLTAALAVLAVTAVASAAASPAAAQGAADVHVDSAVEYDGAVEVVLSENVTRASARNATVTVDGHEVDAVSEGYGPYWWFTLDRDVPANASVEVDFGNVVTEDGTVARNVTADVETTGAVVREYGDADSPDEAASLYRGETVAFVADDLDTDLTVRGDGAAIDAATRGLVMTYDTSRLESGETYEVTFDGARKQYVNASRLNLTATAEPSSVEPNETVTITATANRGNAPVDVQVRSDDAVVETDRYLGSDLRATFEYRPQEPGDYTVSVTDVETGLTANTSLTVEAPDDGPEETPGDAPAVESAVEYDGTVEVVFSENVSAESVRDATVTVDGYEVDALRTGYGPHWEFVLDEDVPENATVRIDFGTVVAQDGATARNVTTDVDVSSAVVRGGGNATSPETAVNVTRGETIAFASAVPDTRVTVRGETTLIQASTRGDAYLYDTKALDPGLYEVTFGENGTQYFAVEPLNLTATVEPSVVEPNETVTIAAEANRDDEPVDIEIHSDDTFVTTSGAFGWDGRATYEYRPQQPGNYTVTVTDARTGITAGESVEVRQAPEPPASPVANATPTDPDGDGLYEDLNGNGEIDYDDVVSYFENVENDALADHVDAYDYNGNGEIDYADLVALFEQV